MRSSAIPLLELSHPEHSLRSHFRWMRPRRRPMLSLNKRWVSIGIIAVLIIFALTFPLTVLPKHDGDSDSDDTKQQTGGGGDGGKQVPVQAHSCPLTPPTTPYVPQDHARFNWRNVPAAHPVRDMARMGGSGGGSEALELPRVQFDFAAAPTSDAHLAQQGTRRAKVKAVFQRCWASYRRLAWMADELTPLTGQSKQTFGGWGATLVDSLDTLTIMGMDQELEEAVAAAVDIDFDPEKTSTSPVNMFETTIRYLGGFIAAYDLSGCKDERLLSKAVEIGDMIYASYDTPNRMPITRWDPRKAAKGQRQDAADNAILAEFASSSVEFVRLSQLTGDMRWFDASERVAAVLSSQQSKTKLPGLWPVGINVRDQDLTRGADFTFGAMSDSAYEYLPKTYALLGASDGGAAQKYADMYAGVMAVAQDHLFYRPVLPDAADVRFSGSWSANSQRLDSATGHLSCFVGGMAALGGRLLRKPDHVDLGARVADGCVWAYNHSTLGIMPETFRMDVCAEGADCRADGGDGFSSVGDRRYILRPEAIESVFYMYRITGDSRWQDVAWTMFEAIEKATHTELANAAVADVTDQNAPKQDSMESFWLGETLKYFYLVFSEPDLISLDDFVFNTEAHPFRRPKR